jgi:hypothetical protein
METSSRSAPAWYKNSFRRNMLDMHIEDWDESFLSCFDSRAYVEMLTKAHIQSTVLFANSHVGYCYWPTPVGKMHGGLKGRDLLGELTGLLKTAGIGVVLYYSCIYDNWAYQKDASWRVIDMEGKSSRERGMRSILTGRYGVCCPNSPGYRGYISAQLGDIAGRYDIRGVFLDMTFWPNVCFCPSCTERYEKEIGGKIPAIIDWNDETWNRLQKKREDWIYDFVSFASGVVREKNPSLTVTHQSSPLLHPWICAGTEALQDKSDFCSGDFYGGFFQQSFICKFYHNLSKNRPFELHTTRCYPNYSDSTTIKSEDALEMHADISLAHHGAILFADAMDPLGRLDPLVYRAMENVFGRTKDLDPYLGGEFVQEAAVYFSSTSKMDFSDNGKVILQGSASMPHLNAAFGAAHTLQNNHVPYGVMGRKNLADPGALKVLILPEILFLDEVEKASIEKYVMNGGSLYASGPRICRLLPRVFGVSCTEETKETVTYITPSPRGTALFPSLDALHPLSVFDKLPIVAVESEEDVMATVVLPYTDPRITDQFSAIHSDPPGIPTRNPAVVMKRLGKGRIVWISHPLEKAEQPSHRRCFMDIVSNLAGGPFSFEMDAPPAVEAVVFHQRDRKRFIVHVLNIQEELPPVVATGIKARLAMKGWRLKSVTSAPEKKRLRSRQKDGWLEFEVPPTRLYSIVCVDYR